MDAPGLTDTDLIRLVVLRDEGALATLYDRHSRLAYSLAMRILRSPSDAEEILQETFVRIWSRAHTYEPALGSPAAWLSRIARNCAIDRLRARRTRQDVDGAPPESDVPSVEPSTAVTPERLFEDQRTSVSVRGALGTLPPPQRMLIEAAFFEGYTHQELSERYGLPLGTVKARIRTGLLALRSQLQAV
ncbi:MAG: sigma-70 family RNA polymerase sigma factor [Vicinamibacterales bacterium]